MEDLRHQKDILKLTDLFKEIAEKLIEGVNFPGMHKPMLIDSSGLPEGWQKKVVMRKPQREGGLRFEILVSHPEITKGTNFTGKNKLQAFFDKKQIPMTAESFDFHNDPKIQKLGQIWKAYRMSPSLKKVPKPVKESMAVIKNEKLIVDNQTLPIDPATFKMEPGILDNSDNWSELSLEEEVLSLEEESRYYSYITYGLLGEGVKNFLLTFRTIFTLKYGTFTLL